MSRQFKCKHRTHPPFTPMEYQTRAVQAFLESKERGMLLYHLLGSGKTCSSVLAIDQYRKNNETKAYVFSPASLRSNYVSEYCNVCGHDLKGFYDNFVFYAYNNTKVLSKLPNNLNNSIIVVDECHRLINGKSNNSKIQSYIYDLIANAKDSRVILLSGTPLYSGEFDLSLICNLIKPGAFPMVEAQFMKLIKSDNYVMERIKGVISYVPKADDMLYPKLIFAPVDILHMSDYQFQVYREKREREIKRFAVDPDEKEKFKNKKEYDKKKALKFITQTMLKSRQICNFVYPFDTQELLDTYIKDDQIDDEKKGERGEKKKRGAKPKKNTAPDDDQLVDDELLAALKKYSPKFQLIMKRILTIPGKHVVYSFFKTRYGVYLMDAMLRHCKIKPLQFTGDLDDRDRNKVLKKFNSTDNLFGQKYKVLLISGAGALGITVKAVRRLHVMESDVNEMVIQQVVGRVNRVNSHADLPPDQRDVTVHRYFCDIPEGELVLSETKSSDLIAWERGKRKYDDIEKLQGLMKRGSIDCEFNYANCYKSKEQNEKKKFY